MDEIKWDLVNEGMYVIKKGCINIPKEIEDVLLEDVGLYHIAVIIVLNNEHTQFDMHRVCTKNQAIGYIKQMKAILKDAYRVSDDKIKESWFTLIDNIHGEYRIKIEKRDNK